MAVMAGSYLLLKAPRDVGLPPPQHRRSEAPTEEQHPWEETLAKTLLFFLKSRQVWLICIAVAAMTMQSGVARVIKEQVPEVKEVIAL